MKSGWLRKTLDDAVAAAKVMPGWARPPKRAEYRLNSPDELQWCNTHQRRARYLCCKSDGSVTPCCGPGQSGILMPCECVRLNGIAEIQCSHAKWAGIPEVDAYCIDCGKDEMEIDLENRLKDVVE